MSEIERISRMAKTKLSAVIEKKLAEISRLKSLQDNLTQLSSEIDRIAEENGITSVSDEYIFRTACGSVGADHVMVRGRRRFEGICKQRAQIVRKLTELGWSSIRIADAMERDHGTILHYRNHFSLR